MRIEIENSAVVVAPTDVVEKILKKMNRYEKEVINYVRKDKDSFMGNKVSVFSCVYGDDDSWTDDFYMSKCEGISGKDGDLTEPAIEVWQRFIKILDKETNEIIQFHQDF